MVGISKEYNRKTRGIQQEHTRNMHIWVLRFLVYFYSIPRVPYLGSQPIPFAHDAGLPDRLRPVRNRKRSLSCAFHYQNHGFCGFPMIVLHINYSMVWYSITYLPSVFQAPIEFPYQKGLYKKNLQQLWFWPSMVWGPLTRTVEHGLF